MGYMPLEALLGQNRANVMGPFPESLRFSDFLFQLARSLDTPQKTGFISAAFFPSFFLFFCIC
jgi:hypothetical protein